MTKSRTTGQVESNTVTEPKVGSEVGVPSRRPEGCRRYTVVGIGASAGGLEALERFFKVMPDDSGMTFVLVVHLAPNHTSMLPELLQQHCRMPVVQAENGVCVDPNHVYVIPPNRGLEIHGGCLRLIEPEGRRRDHFPIDTFFHSLAEDQGVGAVGIVLSGTGTDGTHGVQAIKSGLGLVVVQDRQSAKFDGMPTSAAASGAADHVLPPEEMPECLVRFVEHAEVLDGSPGVPDAETLELVMHRIHALLRTHSGHDFSLYKPNTIRRRIERRMKVLRLDTIERYLSFMQHSRSEAGLLFQELLIGVTEFFRDAEAYRALQEEVLPQILESKEDGDTFRIWVPGCATGEEVYSLAIALHECMERAGKHLHIQIFGTDIDEKAIKAARAGVFPESALGGLATSRIQAFFTPEENGHYRVKMSIREMIVFAEQSVVRDPPFTKLDLLSCRNLLIYLEAELQAQLLPVFHYSLSPGGVLFLGSSESVGESSDLFSPLVPNLKIFLRVPGRASGCPKLVFPVLSASNEGPGSRGRSPMETPEDRGVLKLVETILQQSDMPPCAIIDENNNVVYIHGRTGKFLEPAEGKATANIVEMARWGLRTELMSAIRLVAARGGEATCKGLEIKDEADKCRLDLTVKPILEQTASHGLKMVIFEEDVSSGPGTGRGKKTTQKKRSVAELEEELLQTRGNLQSTIEKLETANEELKSSNEELQSTNEELQSTNEELETSKEELQSVNEESTTVNTELQARITDLSQINDDMKNLLDSTEIATIFLDSDLCIRRFTPVATRIIPLVAVDISRPIQHLSSHLLETNLVETARLVLRDLAVQESLVKTAEGQYYQMKARPYRTTANVIDGVVLTFEDCTERIQAQNRLHESEHLFRTLFNLSTSAMALVRAEDMRICEFNTRAYEQLGYDREQFSRLTLMDLFGPDHFEGMITSSAILKHLQGDGVAEELITRSSGTLPVIMSGRGVEGEASESLLLTWVVSRAEE